MNFLKLIRRQKDATPEEIDRHVTALLEKKAGLQLEIDDVKAQVQDLQQEAIADESKRQTEKIRRSIEDLAELEQRLVALERAIEDLNGLRQGAEEKADRQRLEETRSEREDLASRVPGAWEEVARATAQLAAKLHAVNGQSPQTTYREIGFILPRPALTTYYEETSRLISDLSGPPIFVQMNMLRRQIVELELQLRRSDKREKPNVPAPDWGERAAKAASQGLVLGANG